MTDFLFRGNLEEIDPAVYELTLLETERQFRKLILIPSESTAPQAVREALGSTLQNLYAEGYPDEETRSMSEEEILNYPERLAHYRRYADPRYYKGVEYADAIEALARRRCAEAFATPAFPAERIFVNVQPLSGAPANNAVYTALINPGDTILGMNLLHGGHLTHGSPVNRSGKLFNVVSYQVDPQTEKIDYDAVEALAKENQPRIIIAGYSSYSWVPDWQRFRSIADSVGAVFLADISHIAGLVAAGVVPSPVGFAHVITFTTHKTLTGPRGACILTTDAGMARRLDRAVFPGEQGGPHVQVFAALATTFMLARTEKFKQLQRQIVQNCQALNDRLAEHDFHMVFGGTNTHLTNLDCKSIKGPDGTPLSGDMAARILDIAGLVMNRNTIPGDKTAQHASAIRMGTPWMTQRGLREIDMVQVADIIADVLHAITPYTIETHQGLATRAKIDFMVLETAKVRVRALAERAGIDSKPVLHGYPHFYYIDDPIFGEQVKNGQVTYTLSGPAVRSYLNYTLTSDVEALKPGQSQTTCLHTPQGAVEGVLICVDHATYQFNVPVDKARVVAAWLRDLSDGYVQFDPDVTRRIPGPVLVQLSPAAPAVLQPEHGETIAASKPYCIGIQDTGATGDPLPRFTWEDREPTALRQTSLYNIHRQMGARMVPFAGWQMPVQYTSIVEEHKATRQTAGLFDVSHMGVFQTEGPDAIAFLDSVCGNDIAALAVGESTYTHFLDPDANVIDDLLVYRRGEDKFLVVVNASNDEKDWAWLNAVREGRVMVDTARPWAKAFGHNVILRNLRDPKEGPDMRVDIALQGPRSRDILLALGADPQTRRRILALQRTQLCETRLGNFDLVVSRTGYTGEKMAFELFIHPDQAPALWNRIVEVGVPLGMKPCGLGARDSLRTEAGLPLYGHEMGGQFNLGVAEAGFGATIKVYKPWFIGRDVYMTREKSRKKVVARFRFTKKGVRVAHPGDQVLDQKGRVVGMVTSCAIDTEGFLTGQVYLDKKLSAEGTQISIFQGSQKAAGKAPAEIKNRDKVALPSVAVIVSRFPKFS
jgi:glycine hydroxymethyltransferase